VTESALQVSTCGHASIGHASGAWQRQVHSKFCAPCCLQRSRCGQLHDKEAPGSPGAASPAMRSRYRWLLAATQAVAATIDGTC